MMAMLQNQQGLQPGQSFQQQGGYALMPSGILPGQGGISPQGGFGLQQEIQQQVQQSVGGYGLQSEIQRQQAGVGGYGLQQDMQRFQEQQGQAPSPQYQQLQGQAPPPPVSYTHLTLPTKRIV